MNLGVQPLRAVFGEIIYAPGARFGPRVQRDLQLVLLHRGEASIEIDAASRHLQAGEVILMTPGRRELFEFSLSEQTAHSWCSITYPPLPEAVRARIGSEPSQLPFSERLRSLVEIGVGLRTETSPSAEALKRKLGETCLWEFFHLRGSNEAPGLPPAVERARGYVQEHFAEPLDLAVLAARAGLTPAHLSRLFRKHLQTTPIRYLWQVRLGEGLRLLRETGLNVSEVAFRCGFQNPFHFSRVVKQQTALSPKGYRERSWRKQPPPSGG